MTIGAPRRVMPSDPVRFNAATIDPTLNAYSLPNNDARIRFTGGRMLQAGPGFPGNLFVRHSDTTYNDGPGFSGRNGTGSFEIYGTFESFEWWFLDDGATRVAIYIDGVATNANGYVEGVDNGGGGYFRRVDLPVSTVPRRVRVYQTGPFGGIRLGAGASLLNPAFPTSASAVFIGDSITEGSVASTAWFRWAEQAAFRLGIDNPIISGVGGSGYVRFIADRNPGYPDHPFGGRINDVLTAVNDGPPDLVVIAGGINDIDFAADEIEAAAYDYFLTLRRGAPNSAIAALGPFSGYGGYPANLPPNGSGALLRTRDAIFRAARRVDGIGMIDVAGWVTASNTDLVFDGTRNGPHPVDYGHALYGQLAAEALARAIAAL